MHTRKHTGGPRRRNSKAILVLSLILLLGLAVGGTVAYLSESTNNVQNIFTRATMDATIEETVENNVKTSITVKNEGTVACYVRVALVSNWVMENGQICTSHAAPADITPGTGWVKGSDGYYYHTAPVLPGTSSSNLLSEGGLVMTQQADGCKMQVMVLSSVIQTSGAESAWGVDPSELA